MDTYLPSTEPNPKKSEECPRLCETGPFDESVTDGNPGGMIVIR